MDYLIGDSLTQVISIYGTLTALCVGITILSFRREIKPKKGDVQGPSTYAYGSIRQYPKPSWRQIAEEFFFMARYWWIAFSHNGFKSHKSVLYGEGLVQTFCINRRPRVVLTPLRAHGSALTIDWMGDWQKANKTTDVINAASFDYGGFGLLLHNAARVLSEVLLNVPYMELRGTELINEASSKEAAAFLGFNHCSFVTSGYTMNLVAFPAMHAAAQQKGHSTVFLMDGSSHNSMMVGSYISTGSKIIRFQHNSVQDLEEKLKDLSKDAAIDIIVGLEGNYSMEGGLPPLPAVIELKKKYSFKIYIDEAHSFLALGRTGRGIVEHYQDMGFPISSKDVDCIGATMSKSVGTIGGMLVVHDQNWANAIQLRLQQMHQTGGSGELPTVVKMRLLQILRKPTLVRKRMAILRQHTIYILESLHKAGLCVHSDYMSPVIVVITISLSGCARFGAECHRLGLAVTMAGPPATDAWRSVGRLCINALLSRDDVEKLVRIVVKAAVNIGNVKPIANKIAESLRYDFKDDSSLDAAIEQESEVTDQALSQLVRAQQTANTMHSINMHDKKVLEHGVDILHKQGLGATSNRLFWGSLLAHVRCEERLSTMYKSLAHVVGEPGSLIMTEARNTVSSTVATSIAPLADKSALHLVLLPENAVLPVREAVKSMKKAKLVQIVFYKDPSEMTSILDRASNTRLHVTLYLPTCNERQACELNLRSTISALTSAKSWRERVQGVQLLLDDTYGFGKTGPRRLGYLDLLESRHGERYLSDILATLGKSVRFFLMASFYEAFKLQGGFVLTSKQMVKILHWTSRASMFATAPLPCNVGMAHKMIDGLCEGHVLSSLPQIATIPDKVERAKTVESIATSLEDEVDSLLVGVA